MDKTYWPKRQELLTRIGDPFFDSLSNDSARNYRVDYQLYRLGYPKGAKGEYWTAFNPPPTDQEDSLCNIYQEDAHCAAYSLLTQWRCKYREFREGAAHGSEGEVGKIASYFTRKHLKLLPVSQLAQWNVFSRLEHPLARQRTRPNFHIHLGAGKLGLGLVLPALVNTHFAILQRDSNAWEECKGGSTMKVMVNNEELMELLVVRTVEELPDLTNLSEEKKTQLLVICDYSHELVGRLGEDYDTVSTALGPAISELPHWLSSLALSHPSEKKNDSETGEKKRAIGVYCCENDHQAVEKLRGEIGEIGEKEEAKNVFSLVPCMVDRICSERIIDAENKLIKVLCEPYKGDITVLLSSSPIPPSLLASPPFHGENVNLSQFEAMSNYFAAKKLLFVNGMHTTLAFLTLCRKEPPLSSSDSPTPSTSHATPNSPNSPISPISPLPVSIKSIAKKTTPVGSYPLLTWDTCDSKDHRLLFSWLVARVILLFYEHDLAIIRHCHHLTSPVAPVSSSTSSTSPPPTLPGNGDTVKAVFNYARACLQRISTVPDTTARVLGAGIALRYHGRLENVQRVLPKATLAPELLSSILKEAKTSLPTVLQDVATLTKDAKRFADASKQ